MKKVINGYGVRFGLMSALALFGFCGCSAQPNNAATQVNESQVMTDSVMRSAIGDSIYSIITEARKIKAEEIVLTNDTTLSTTSAPKAINVKGKFVPLIQFVLSDPKIYNGDMTVYGQFLPCFRLTFINKKECCILNFDFGLKKWDVCDDGGRIIKKFDLPSDGMLRLANMLFPKNNLYKNQINTEKK